MEELIGLLEGIDDMTSANAEKIVLGWIADKGYHLGNVMNAFRLAVVGACRGPHMFDITEPYAERGGYCTYPSCNRHNQTINPQSRLAAYNMGL